MDGHESNVARGFPFCQGSGVTHLVNRTKMLIVMVSGFDAELRLCVGSYSSSLNPVPGVLWEGPLLVSLWSELDLGILNLGSEVLLFPAARSPVGAEPSPAACPQVPPAFRSAAFPPGPPERGSSCSSGR